MTITTDVQLLRNRRTRIVSTLGPASISSPTRLTRSTNSSPEKD